MRLGLRQIPCDQVIGHDGQHVQISGWGRCAKPRAGHALPRFATRRALAHPLGLLPNGTGVFPQNDQPGLPLQAISFACSF